MKCIDQCASSVFYWHKQWNLVYHAGSCLLKAACQRTGLVPLDTASIDGIMANGEKNLQIDLFIIFSVLGRERF